MTVGDPAAAGLYLICKINQNLVTLLLFYKKRNFFPKCFSKIPWMAQTACSMYKDGRPSISTGGTSTTIIIAGREKKWDFWRVCFHLSSGTETLILIWSLCAGRCLVFSKRREPNARVVFSEIKKKTISLTDVVQMTDCS